MLLAISYPKLSSKDFNWIQDFRKKNDKMYYEIVDPHFTFIFPGHEIADEDFEEHIKAKISNHGQIEFSLNCAVIVKDSFIDIWHAFLVPDKGFSSIVKLHDRLYEGIMKEYLLLEIPYIPHIGIATNKDKMVIKGIVDEINSMNISIKGSINTISLFDNDKYESTKTFKL